jgi:multidrug resistance efflux pump
MPNSFSRTLRAFEDRGLFRPEPVLFGCLVCLGTGLGWLLGGELLVLQVSRTMRLESASRTHVVQAAVAGRVASSSVRLGARVAKGDVLLEIDASQDRLAAAAVRGELASVREQIPLAEAQLLALEEASRSARGAAEAQVASALAKQNGERTEAQFAEQLAGRLKRLERAGAIEELESLRAQAHSYKSSASALASSLDTRRNRWEVARSGAERSAELAEGRRQLAALRGRLSVLEAELSKLNDVLERKKLRAPCSGLVGAASELRDGAFVAEGTTVASLIPDGDLIVVAQFEPAAALGRIHPGQRARVRLTSYSWLEFGGFDAVVSRVGSEPVQGQLAVELRLVKGERLPRFFQHGLDGVAEVEIEHTSPARLVLRAAGAALSPSVRPPDTR